MAFIASSAAAPAAVGAAAALPPHVWRANQLASFRAHTIATGHAALDRELPDGGWPTGALMELLVQQHGSGCVTRSTGSIMWRLRQDGYRPAVPATRWRATVSRSPGRARRSSLLV
jgi:hypothetical protein